MDTRYEIVKQDWHSNEAKAALATYNEKMQAADTMEDEARAVRQAALKAEDGATVAKLKADFSELQLDTATARINAVEHLIDDVLPALRESQRAAIEKATKSLLDEQRKRNLALEKVGIRRGVHAAVLKLEAEGHHVKSQYATESEQAAEAHFRDLKQAGYAYGLLQAAGKRDLPALKCEREKLVLSLFEC